MTNYEYHSLTVSGKFKNQSDLDELDRVINDSAADGWELVSTASVVGIASFWSTYPVTRAMLVTFRRVKK